MLDSFNYSVDMVRLYTEIRPSQFQEIMDKFIYNPYVKYREMKQITAYRHNFHFSSTLKTDNELVEVGFDEYGNMYQKQKDESYSFWLGAEHNARPFSKTVIDVVVQYNPNKCKDSELLEYVLENIFLNNPLTRVKNIDFAIDIPYNITDIMLERNLMTSYRLIDNGGDDMTHYMRKRGSNGHLKLYNKARENKEPGNKTRYEITLKIDVDLRFIENYKVDYGLFPGLTIFAKEKQLEISDKLPTCSDKVLTLACIDKPEYLKMLSFRKRKKIEGYIETLVKKVDFTNCRKVENTIYNYFNTLKSKMSIKY